MLRVVPEGASRPQAVPVGCKTSSYLWIRKLHTTAQVLHREALQEYSRCSAKVSSHVWTRVLNKHLVHWCAKDNLMILHLGIEDGTGKFYMVTICLLLVIRIHVEFETNLFDVSAFDSVYLHVSGSSTCLFFMYWPATRNYHTPWMQNTHVHHQCTPMYQYLLLWPEILICTFPSL